MRGGDFVNPNTPNDHTSFFTFVNLATLAAATATTTTTNCATHAIMYCWARHKYRAVRTASPPNLFANVSPPTLIASVAGFNKCRLDVTPLPPSRRTKRRLKEQVLPCRTARYIWLHIE